MPERIVAVFQGTRRAAEVLADVVDRNALLAIHRRDVVGLNRTRSGKLRFESSVQQTSMDGALLGRCVGVIVGSLVAMPFVAARRS